VCVCVCVCVLHPKDIFTKLNTTTDILLLEPKNQNDQAEDVTPN
jgi:hypothetical protein